MGQIYFGDLAGRWVKFESALTGEVRQAIEPLILPVAAKVLAAIAADVVAAIEARNDRPDVKAARTALENAIKLLEKVDPDLQG